MTEKEEELAFLALCTIRGIGYSTLAHIAQAGISFAAFLSNTNGNEASHELRKLGSSHQSNTSCDWQVVRLRAIAEGHRLKEHLNATGIRIILSRASEFPRSLNELANPPSWIFVHGNVLILSYPSVAVVGARKLREDGKWLCKFVGLCFKGWQAPIVTGLATEVDYGVHELALRAGVPTIAVLGAGILSESRSVFRERIISQGGAIVTEYLPYDGYSPQHFDRLGRIQAALSRVLIPIEWSGKSNGNRAVYHAVGLHRPIAALRLSDQSAKDVAFSEEAVQTAEMFTIPGQEEEFRLFVERSIQATNQQRAPGSSGKERVELMGPHKPPRLRLGRGRPPRSHSTAKK